MNCNALIGKTITDIKEYDAGLRITTDCGTLYRMAHRQDCCESVDITSIYGTLTDLIGCVVENVYMNEESLGNGGDDHTKTTAVIRTDKASVTIIWDGYSNGYYGTGVSFWDEEN
jgi:hypothetical protein